MLFQATFDSGIDSGWGSSVSGAGSVAAAGGLATCTTGVNTDNAIIVLNTNLMQNRIWNQIRSHFRVSSVTPRAGSLRVLQINQQASTPTATTLGPTNSRIFCSQAPASGAFNISYRNSGGTTIYWDNVNLIWTSSVINISLSTDTWYKVALSSLNDIFALTLFDNNDSILTSTQMVSWSSLSDTSDPYWFLAGDAVTASYGVVDFETLYADFNIRTRSPMPGMLANYV